MSTIKLVLFATVNFSSCILQIQKTNYSAFANEQMSIKLSQIFIKSQHSFERDLENSWNMWANTK